MIYFVIIILTDILFLYTSLYEAQMLQQNTYNERGKYYKFVINDIKKNYTIYLLKYLLGIALLLFTQMDLFILIVYLIDMLILIVSSFINYVKHNQKLPLKFTKRMLRILIFNYILFIICQFLIIKLCAPFVAGALLLFVSINPFLLILIVFLLTPVEKIIFNHYKKSALSKLNKMNNINIIGITGSFGKTSTKMILNSILETKLKGFYTPNSFNTPNGMLLTLNRQTTIFNDYFIAEMGAKYVGEIEELCDLVHPKYAIITSIGAAHLETFKSLDNICKTKFELVDSLPDDGVAVLNIDDEYQKNYQRKSNCKVIWVGLNSKADVSAKNIKIDSKGTTFDIYFKKDKKTITVNTILLGNKNVYNILSSVALANYFGLSDKEIIKGVKNIAPINHRLEIKNINNITLIDDSFNSNPEGAKNAVEVLSLMEGKKIIITPGMIEMGNEQAKLNKEFGKQIAKVADEVYLVGKKQTLPIYEGLENSKYNMQMVKVFNRFKDAYNDIIKSSGNKKITVLIENDLPDSYTEE